MQGVSNLKKRSKTGFDFCIWPIRYANSEMLYKKLEHIGKTFFFQDNLFNGVHVDNRDYLNLPQPRNRL